MRLKLVTPPPPRYHSELEQAAVLTKCLLDGSMYADAPSLTPGVGDLTLLYPKSLYPSLRLFLCVRIRPDYTLCNQSI